MFHVKLFDTVVWDGWSSNSYCRHLSFAKPFDCSLACFAQDLTKTSRTNHLAQGLEEHCLRPVPKEETYGHDRDCDTLPGIENNATF